MKQRLMRSMIAAIAATIIALPVLAAETGNVSVELKGQKVVKGPDGKERYESADKAKPGDVIEYRAVYRNTGKKSAANLLATIPVPLGTEYIPGSARPAKVSASTGGTEFAPVPLKRKVILPSGKEETRNIPSEEYRSIRWELKSLSPGKNSTFSMRVRISTAPTEAPAKK